MLESQIFTLQGIVMNVLCIFIVVCGIGSWGNEIFHLDEIPSWTINGTIPPDEGC